MTPEFRVFTGQRPPTVNRLMRMHWATRERALDEWRDAAWAGIREGRWQHTRYVRAEVTHHPIYPRGTLPDGDALALVAKAVTDVVVAAGIIPDDNPHHCVHGVHTPARNPAAPHPLIVVEIVPVAAVAGHDGDCGCRAAWEASQRHNQMKAAR